MIMYLVMQMVYLVIQRSPLLRNLPFAPVTSGVRLPLIAPVHGAMPCFGLHMVYPCRAAAWPCRLCTSEATLSTTLKSLKTLKPQYPEHSTQSYAPRRA